MSKSTGPNAGLYIHIPFCKSLCHYCDFYSKVAYPGEIDRFVDAVGIEATIRAGTIYGDFTYDSIFLGGGTPSLLNSKQIASLFGKIRANFKITDKAEITIECNPSSVERELLRCYKDIGINRISLGVQSFNNIHLAKLGRLHDSRGAQESFSLMANAGFNNIGLDLIYGLPGQTLLEWQDDLKQAVALSPTHISAYNLIIEPDTQFGKLFEEGRLKLPSEDVQNMMYGSLYKYLSDSGFLRYEISNFAKPGRQCRHNLKYWHLIQYLGLGPAAVSFDGVLRQKNASDLDSYFKAAKWMDAPPCEIESLDSVKLRQEAIMMGLRLGEGLSCRMLKDRFDYDIMASKAAIIDTLIKNGYITIDNDHLKLTSDAFFISDEIIVKLI
jgi:oxygen-independent coproporphyrinogen-3 oxidase